MPCPKENVAFETGTQVRTHHELAATGASSVSAADERLRKLNKKKFLQVAENVSFEEWDQNETSRIKDNKVVM